MTHAQIEAYPRRVYPLDPRQLTQEQIAVAFAMTSRRPEPFDEIAQQVSQEKAADFHERWVLGYGHASVAEHAVLHLAVENISRLACDTLEDNRLASYTEKSSRYQVMPPDCFHFPQELADTTPLPPLAKGGLQPKAPHLSEGGPGKVFREACQRLFQDYRRFIDGCMGYLRNANPQEERERESAYNLRLRRIATDSCRLVLPAATLTNVGVTANARVLEHAISKLLSSELAEERELGRELRDQSRSITPTLIKYAEANPYLQKTAQRQRKLAEEKSPQPPFEKGGQGGISSVEEEGESRSRVQLVQWDALAEEKLAAALLYRQSTLGYDAVWQRVLAMGPEQRQEIIDRCVAELGPHDAPVREFEVVDYTFEFLLDYGAYREFKRHRMQAYFPQPLTVAHGYGTPELLGQAGLAGEFGEALERLGAAYWQVYQSSPLVAQYLVTHAHYRRVLSKMNLRECYHLFKLRTSKLAHFSIREPVIQAMRLAVATHPQLFRRLSLRDYPDWWPFPKPTER
jgi:thymidylate synthase ThyX